MDSCRLKLSQGLAEIAMQITDFQLQQLLNFILLIKKWNKAYNLTAVREPLEMIGLHILDSLVVLQHIKSPRIADIGTGAGIPGIPLAICMPDCQFTLVDSNSKKTRFVQQVIMELQLKNVKVMHSRVEMFQTQQVFTTIVSRAFSNLGDFIKLTEHLLSDDGVLLAMKGQVPEQELVTLARRYTVIPLDVPGVAADRCLIRLENVKHG